VLSAAGDESQPLRPLQNRGRLLRRSPSWRWPLVMITSLSQSHRIARNIASACNLSCNQN
jgi:hypothetical protein